MYKNLREFTEFLVGIGKRYCCNEDVAESARLTIIQQQIMTGFMIKDDLTHENQFSVPNEIMGEAFSCFSSYLTGEDEIGGHLLHFLSDRAVHYYYNQCAVYLDSVWSEKQCEMK